MKKRSLWLITGLMTVALLGVFVMQLYYIREAYNLKSQLFEQDVQQALNAVVNKVQRRYAAVHITKKDYEVRKERERDFRNKAQRIIDFKEQFKEQEIRRKREQQRKVITDLNMRDSIVRVTFLKPELISEEVYQEISNVNNKGKSSLQVQVDFGVDAFGNVRGNVNQTVVSKRSSTFTLAPDHLADSIRYLAYNPQNLNPITVTLERVTPELALKFSIEDKTAVQRYLEGLKELMQDTVALEGTNLNYLEDVAKEMRQVYVPINQRVSIDALDTLIKKELQDRNVSLNYDFWLKLANKDSVLYQKVSNAQTDILPENTYRTTLFSNEIFRDPGMLYLYFPNKNSLILSNMWATMASSAGLLLVLIFIFAYTIYAILKQKKISEMKTDFINNMTHEFKTPVATIMIASEALKDPEVVADKSRISRLAGIIYDENVRLGNHIERVLSIARLEKKELKLEHKDVDIHDLISAVVDSMSLQLQRKNAKVTLNLNASHSMVSGDELHLSNVFFNLVDNANKYSANAPDITITTRSTDKMLTIEISDQGIGMTKEHAKRIFDQFYRVPTGNLHDVKGFGLGLNYVQDIVEQMNGSIKVLSEKDKGTTFEINLPLNHN
ncbi:HAMP domain-containing histidine kinase [Pedobacter hiemivivus]|uniref:histidine kinase n=1 Tax=Pedobacter hiemivivus TaxID=2530454 RepID=A0A4U1G8Y0_9SPHI|nr:HAMP domain-containing sensor histidine kinase [Pedobacter hiemivivus]TKC60367.1 HAMP domain-containing histidine kinase [Pedobacter hiemivivus]